MSRAADIALSWGDGEYTFALTIGALRQVQEKTGVGPLVLWRRLVEGTWLVDDARTVLFHGLVGAGMEPAEASAKVRTWCDERPPVESVLPATAVLQAGLFGPADETVGKAGAPQAATETTGCDSPPSMASAP